MINIHKMISTTDLPSFLEFYDNISTTFPSPTDAVRSIFKNSTGYCHSEDWIIPTSTSGPDAYPSSSPSPPTGGPTTSTFLFVINAANIIIACLGIIGNILSAIVLSRPQMKSSVTCLLLALTFCDSLLIFISILIFGLPAVSDYTGTIEEYRHVYFPLWVPYLFPLSVTAQTGSVYLTLAVTIERYVAVCHPLRARSLCTWKRARYCVATVFTMAIIYNLPRWFEVCTCILGVDADLNTLVYQNLMCEIRQDPLYITIYINWMYLFVMYLIPFSGLVVFNWAIYRQVSGDGVRKANRERQALSKLQRREMGLATMLLFVVLVFLICNILPLVINILESFYNWTEDKLVQTSNFLVVFNSSVNFVIYCTCGERFRKLLFRLCRDFLWCRLGNRNSLRGSVYRKSNFYRSQQGVEFEEVSLASVANTHTCLTNTYSSMHNGHGGGGAGGNGSVLLDLNGSSGDSRGNRNRLNNYRNKTIPSSNVHYPSATQHGILINKNRTNNNTNPPKNVNGNSNSNNPNKLFINRTISSPVNGIANSKI